MKLEITKEQADLIIGSLSFANAGKPNMSRGKYHDQAVEIVRLIKEEKKNAE